MGREKFEALVSAHAMRRLGDPKRFSQKPFLFLLSRRASSSQECPSCGRGAIFSRDKTKHDFLDSSQNGLSGSSKINFVKISENCQNVIGLFLEHKSGSTT